MIMKRSEAERWGYDILGSAPSWVTDTDDVDLVVVNAEPVSASERCPT